MREERKLHHAEELDGGEMERRAADEDRKLHHAVERRDGGELHMRGEEVAPCSGGGEMEESWRGSCIPQWRAAEELDGGQGRWRRAADEGGEEAAPRSGEQRRREMGERRNGGELQMRGEEAASRRRDGDLQMREEERKLHHAEEIAGEQQRS